MVRPLNDRTIASVLFVAARLQLVEDLSKPFVTHIAQRFGRSGFLVV
jgi:hypothetical protein